MGKKLDALLGRRSSKTSKLKALLALTISRVAILKNQRNARCFNATEDIAVLLHHGHHDRAILRAEYVIKEQNIVDVFMMVESYCNLLIERSILLEQNHRECPHELKEAVCSLVFMASRSGELHELQDIRSIFASLYGYEFVTAAVELRSGAVNTKIVQKMSTNQPDLESRLKVVKDVASDKGLPFNLEYTLPQTSPVNPIKGGEETSKQSDNKDPSPSTNPISPANTHDLHKNKGTTNSMELKDKFHDATSAAQAAFESAAFAAAAARAAVELSRSGSKGKGPRNDSKQQVEIKSMARRDEKIEGSPIGWNRSQRKEVVMSDTSEEESSNSEDDIKRSRVEGEIKIPQKPFSVRTRRGGL